MDRAAEHLKLCYGDRQVPVALVAREVNKDFTVEFLVNKRITDRLASRMAEAVRRELDTYLLHAVGPDSWAFARYHCDTAANRCSAVHWSWQPKAGAI